MHTKICVEGLEEFYRSCDAIWDVWNTYIYIQLQLLLRKFYILKVVKFLRQEEKSEELFFFCIDAMLRSDTSKEDTIQRAKLERNIVLDRLKHGYFPMELATEETEGVSNLM